MKFCYVLIKICSHVYISSWGFNWQKVGDGSYKGLMLSGQQAITWTDDGTTCLDQFDKYLSQCIKFYNFSEKKNRKKTTTNINFHDPIHKSIPGSQWVNPLCAKFFQREHKHIFTFCVISPHWYHAGSWNPSSNKTRTYLFYIVNIMAADVLAM